MAESHENRKKYNYMENINVALNKQCISLIDDERKRNNKILLLITENLIEKLQESDVLFKNLYRTLYFGGSYYDNLKVGRPDEYDLDLLFCLPKYAKPTVTCSKSAGYVSLNLTNYENHQKQPEAKASFSDLGKLLDKQHYLINGKVLRWMESILTKVMNSFPERNSEHIYTIDGVDYALKIIKGGPAFTLKIVSKNCDKEIYMDVDLVPCFVCDKSQLPYMLDETKMQLFENKSEFFVVPKAPKIIVLDSEQERCWRLSFQEQEKLKMEGYQNFKPALRFMKKLRDNLDHKIISSYFIKTVFLFELDEQKKEFWCLPLSFIFVHMLKVYYKHLVQEQIPYFWNINNNLLISSKSAAIQNICNKIKRIIDSIENNFTNNPYIVANALLSSKELEALKLEIGHVDENKSISTVTESFANSAIFSSSSDINILLQLETNIKNLTEKVQNDNERVISILEKLSDKIDRLEFKVDEFRAENNLLKKQLKDLVTEE